MCSSLGREMCGWAEEEGPREGGDKDEDSRAEQGRCGRRVGRQDVKSSRWRARVPNLVCHMRALGLERVGSLAQAMKRRVESAETTNEPKLKRVC